MTTVSFSCAFWSGFRLLMCVAALGGAAEAAYADACSGAKTEFALAKESLSPQTRLFHLERSISDCPKFASWYLKGRTLLELGNFGAALDAFKQAHGLADNGHYAGLAFGRIAEAHLAMGDKAAAMGAIESAVASIDEVPTWLQELRKTIDLSISNDLMMSQTIETVLKTTRSFGVEPRVNVRIRFAFGSAELDAQGIAQVEELGRALARFQNEGYFIELIGHTDKQGDEAYNQRLSEARASAVARRLSSENAPLAERLRYSGKGESEPLYTGDAEEEHQLNRRVEVTLIN